MCIILIFVIVYTGSVSSRDLLQEVFLVVCRRAGAVRAPAEAPAGTRRQVTVATSARNQPRTRTLERIYHGTTRTLAL